MKYATIWRRFWALVLDFLILSPVLILTYYIKHHVQNSAILAAGTTLNYSYATVYSIWMHTSYGQTLGKMVMKVRVLNLAETRPPSFREAFMMDIYSVLACSCMIGLALYMIATHTYSPHAFVKAQFFRILLYLDNGWLIAELTCVLANKKRRSLHDLIAGTVVVRDRDYVLESAMRMQRMA